MNKTEVMKKLKALGNERYATTLSRHGVDGNAYGVSYAELYKLQKAIGTDHALAENLWKTANHDARILATLIADPDKLKITQLDQWVKSADNQISRDAIATVTVNSKVGRRCAEKWIEAKAEGIAAAGWWVLAGLAERPEAFSDAELGRYLKRIKKEIGGERNRVKHSMNQAIIGIGVRNEALRKQALGVAQDIGKVEVDHGDTSCKTPDAGAYIFKVMAHRRKMRKAADERAAKKTAGSKAKTSKAPAKAKATKVKVTKVKAPAKKTARKTAAKKTATRKAPRRKAAAR
ncbi:MAG: DNA alkylation repair protein [Planctomycetota bacterium]